MIGSYKPRLDLTDTEKGIKLIKDDFEERLAANLDLQRVSAPRFLEVGNGLQDDLAGTQEPVRFQGKGADQPIEMVQSLAKWKRMALWKYGIPPGKGLYTDMDAIRKDEDVDAIHSYYVDQWDWEKVITSEQRSIPFLEETVREIYQGMRKTEAKVEDLFPALKRSLPDSISFIHAQDLEDRFPDLLPRDREDRAAEEYGAFFLIGIGGKLKSGKAHDLRAADYDDWITETEPGRHGLNGDIIVFDSVRGKALELSSMGIRVDRHSLVKQLEIMDQTDRKTMEFQRGILEDRIPLSIGGGIGQSRLCMLLLKKRHIGEVQVSVWPEQIRRDYESRGVFFL